MFRLSEKRLTLWSRTPVIGLCAVDEQDVLQKPCCYKNGILYLENTRGDELERTITYILEGGQFGVQEGYVVMGIKEREY